MFDTASLKTFKISNGALRGASLPSRLKVFGWGDNQSTDGVYRAGDKTASVLSANQKSKGYERVAIDFDHCSVPGTETNKQLMAAGQPPLIFGYGDVVPKVGDGIYLENIVWTPLGIQHAKNFEDISPALADDNREVTLIHSVALTPNGKVTGLQFFSSNQPSNPMNENNVILISDLAPVFGLSATAGKDVVLAKLAVLSLVSGLVKIADNKIVSLGGHEIIDGALAIPDITSLSARVKTIEDAGNKGIATLSATIGGVVKTFGVNELVGLLAEVDGLKKKFDARETAETESARGAVIKLFSADGKVPKNADGKIYSAEELAKLDVPTLRLLHANTPVTVPLSARHLTSLTEGGGSFKDAKGIVDLAAIFDKQNAAAAAS